MQKQEIIDLIVLEEDKLNELDVDGHIWWNKFRRFIEAIPDYKFKTKWCDNCGSCIFIDVDGDEMWLCKECISKL